MKALEVSMLALLLVACGAKDEEEGGGAQAAINASAATGTAGGMPWTFAAGETDSFLSDESSFFLTLYGEAVTACSGAFPDSASITMIVPRAPGDYPLGSMQFATFSVPPDQNLATDQGHIRIDAVTATEVTGGIQAEFDAANSVNGTFTATICP